MDGWAAVHGAAKSDRSERLTNLKCYFRSPFRLGKEMHTDKCNPPNMSALCAGPWVRCSAQGEVNESSDCFCRHLPLLGDGTQVAGSSEDRATTGVCGFCWDQRRKAFELRMVPPRRSLERFHKRKEV